MSMESRNSRAGAAIFYTSHNRRPSTLTPIDPKTGYSKEGQLSRNLLLGTAKRIGATVTPHATSETSLDLSVMPPQAVMRGTNEFLTRYRMGIYSITAA